MNQTKCNSFNICEHGDEVGISLQKCKECKKLSNFSMKKTDISNLKVSDSGEVIDKIAKDNEIMKHPDETYEEVIDRLKANNKIIPSLTDILWRELKKHHEEYCKKLSLDPAEYWGKYQIHLIKESQGE